MQKFNERTMKVKIKQSIKSVIANEIKSKWENKIIHEWYIQNLDAQLISEKDTFLCFTKGELKGER